MKNIQHVKTAIVGCGGISDIFFKTLPNDLRSSTCRSVARADAPAPKRRLPSMAFRSQLWMRFFPILKSNLW